MSKDNFVNVNGILVPKDLVVDSVTLRSAETPATDEHPVDSEPKTKKSTKKSTKKTPRRTASSARNQGGSVMNAVQEVLVSIGGFVEAFFLTIYSRLRIAASFVWQQRGFFSLVLLLLLVLMGSFFLRGCIYDDAAGEIKAVSSSTSEVVLLEEYQEDTPPVFDLSRRERFNLTAEQEREYYTLISLCRELRGYETMLSEIASPVYPEEVRRALDVLREEKRFSPRNYSSRKVVKDYLRNDLTEIYEEALKLNNVQRRRLEIFIERIDQAEPWMEARLPVQLEVLKREMIRFKSSNRDTGAALQEVFGHMAEIESLL